MKLTVLFTAVAGLCLAADAKDDAVKAEKAKLQGTWKVVSLEIDGTKAPEEDIKKMSLVFQDGKAITRRTGDKDYEATYTIDPSQKPATVEFVSGNEKEKPIRCIYLLNGDDLKICASMPGDARPKEFTSKKGEQTSLIVLKREKR